MNVGRTAASGTEQRSQVLLPTLSVVLLVPPPVRIHTYLGVNGVNGVWIGRERGTRVPRERGAPRRKKKKRILHVLIGTLPLDYDLLPRFARTDTTPRCANERERSMLLTFNPAA